MDTSEIMYISLAELVSNLPTRKGDIIYISSDILELAKACRRNGEVFDRQAFIKAIQLAVGKEGTLLFPTFNWDFCQGIAFDYLKTPGKTGALGNAALKMPGFMRTKHPIYSFAVCGHDAKMLADMDNTSSFGDNSPFAYLYNNNATNLLIGVTVPQSFTFTHFVEEQCRVPYRYMKDFTANYTEAGGETSRRTYSMYVRDLERDTTVRLSPMEREFLESGAAQEFEINNVHCMTINLRDAFDLIKRDILENRGRKIVSYDGQEE